MEIGVLILKGDNSYIAGIFLNVGLARKGGAGTIEDENQECRNSENNLNKRVQQWLCLFEI
jgi:hypothetical protein